MLCDPTGQDLVNSFALVAYIPAPLSTFLDDLRRELAPGCVPHAHVTILPPRPIAVPREEAIEFARARSIDFGAFEIELGPLELFDSTEVAYLSVSSGFKELVDMHEAFNTGPLWQTEPYVYHPHVTLAQDLEPGEYKGRADIARRAWEAYAGPRKFPVETITFVQATVKNLWVDLANFQLEGAPVRR
jgi:2'-5' RNA ligase